MPKRRLAVTQDSNRHPYFSPYNDVTQRQRRPPRVPLHFPGCFANSDAIGRRRRKCTSLNGSKGSPARKVKKTGSVKL
ncbi:hypothetical protein PAL_GLEAN10018834 [Pteropus alecto]|uniref:Uncharacterized protein n=1 Tax=Pteropus alecto TaxID=9402 RepID=L5L0R2_PTEAL|nr:hypothetical protein PAL_GLEAN10018834 [Pteropus alecto]